MLKTHCKHGHELTRENVRMYGPDKSWRLCLVCKREADRIQRARPGKKEEAVRRGREWRLNNLERSRASALRHYDSIREIIEAAKSVPCMDCGIQYPFYVMDFDHRDPSEKTINVGTARSKSKTIEEIEKCDVVCANCHRERTWKDKVRGRKK
jgi:hypothetical protein